MVNALTAAAMQGHELMAVREETLALDGIAGASVTYGPVPLLRAP
jgi:hypothetical protein